jgi:hypothetical protein
MDTERLYRAAGLPFETNDIRTHRIFPDADPRFNVVIISSKFNSLGLMNKRINTNMLNDDVAVLGINI